MDERARRVVENESRFRLLNERLRTHGEDGGERPGTLTVLCECADHNCAQPIDVSLEAYEWARAESVRFIVVHGHELPPYETVVRDDGAYLVVAKHEDARPEATDLDPRAD
jgi:hypothetical protein